MLMEKPQTPGWTSLSSKELCRTKVLSLWSETAKSLRTGASNDFITFKCRDWVNVRAVTPEGLLVCIRQFRHGSRKTELEIPGGCIDPSDADPIAAGARELLEETGFQGEEGRLIGGVCPNPALQGNLCHTVKFVNARQVAPPNLEATESIEMLTLADADLKNLVRTGALQHGLVLDALLFHWLDEAKT
jgi:8-oxo-dGTP pyrophosphatase MutT (NUDIX family)